MGAAFSINISDWCKKAKVDVDKACRVIVMDLFTHVVEKTPVWNGPGPTGGSARANWQVGYNQIPTGIVGSKSADVAAFAGMLKSPVAGNVVYFVNNLPYIGILEYGGFPNPPKSGTGRTIGGYSTQAPAGMVRLAIQEVSSKVAQLVR